MPTQAPSTRNNSATTGTMTRGAITATAGANTHNVNVPAAIIGIGTTDTDTTRMSGKTTVGGARTEYTERAGHRT